MNKMILLLLISFVLVFSGTVLAQDDLAKQSQNPLGTIISLPFENNFYFNIGPAYATAYALTLKPVYPVDHRHQKQSFLLSGRLRIKH